MKTQTQIRENQNHFHFEGIDRDEQLEKNAKLKLFQLLPLAPPGAHSFGTVARSGGTFVAGMTIYSPYRSFSAQAVGLSAASAIKKALDRLEDRLIRWRWGEDEGNYESGSGRSGISSPPFLPAG